MVIRNLPANKRPGSDSFTAEFYQKFRDELTPILLKLLQKIAEEGKLPNSFYEAIITLISRPDKHATHPHTHTHTHKLQANITDEHRCKNSLLESNFKIEIHPFLEITFKIALRYFKSNSSRVS